MPETSSIPPRVRKMMRRVPHPIAIVTATDTAVVEGGPHAWRGATVSSFNVVTLEPLPIVSFNIKQHSSTYDAIRNSEMFLVHLMNDSPEAVDVALRFTKGNARAPFTNGKEQVAAFIHKNNIDKPHHKSDEPPYIQSHFTTRVPLVSFALLCRYSKAKSVEIGDHVIVVGSVEHIRGDHFDDADSQPRPGQLCLAYAHGAFLRRQPATYRDRSQPALNAPAGIQILRSRFEQFQRDISEMDHFAVTSRIYSGLAYDKYLPVSTRRLLQKMISSLTHLRSLLGPGTLAPQWSEKRSWSKLAAGLRDCFMQVFIFLNTHKPFRSENFPGLSRVTYDHLLAYRESAEETGAQSFAICNLLQLRYEPGERLHVLPMSRLVNLNQRPFTDMSDSLQNAHAYWLISTDPYNFKAKHLGLSDAYSDQSQVLFSPKTMTLLSAYRDSLHQVDRIFRSECYHNDEQKAFNGQSKDKRLQGKGESRNPKVRVLKVSKPQPVGEQIASLPVIRKRPRIRRPKPS